MVLDTLYVHIHNTHVKQNVLWTFTFISDVVINYIRWIEIWTAQSLHVAIKCMIRTTGRSGNTGYQLTLICFKLAYYEVLVATGFRIPFECSIRMVICHGNTYLSRFYKIKSIHTGIHFLLTTMDTARFLVYKVKYEQ